MRQATLPPILLAAALNGSVAAVAQTPPAPVGPALPSPSPATLSASMEATLRKAGFTDLQILPNSVLVRGTDKAGHPVAMVLNPQTMTEVVTLDPHDTTAGAGTAPLTGSTTFITALPHEVLASRLTGTPLVGRGGEALGTIRDLVLDHGGLAGYVVRTGGVLGIGARYTAVTPAAVAVTPDGATGRFKAVMDATADQMKAAPDFTYEAVDEATR